MRKVTEDFIGTCQACFGEFKVNEKSRQIVFHGYRRPGHGHTEGQCAGTDHAPFEYDTDLTVQIIKMHRDRAYLRQSFKDRLEAGKVDKLTRWFKVYNPTTRREDDTSEEIGPDNQHWDWTKRRAIESAASDVNYHTRVGDYLQAMVDVWKRGQIVGIDVPATGRERALRKAYDPVKADALAARAAEKAARDAKPGKLKVTFYQPSLARPGDISHSDDSWRNWIEAKDKQQAEFMAGIKAWVKANITSKSIVRSGYDFDLPRGIRPDGRTASSDVVNVNLPWEYRDKITTMFSTAVIDEDQPKRISYTVAGTARSH